MGESRPSIIGGGNVGSVLEDNRGSCRFCKGDSGGMRYGQWLAILLLYFFGQYFLI